MTAFRIHKGRYLSAVMIIFMTLLAALSGCTMANYGKLMPNQEIKKSFETYQVLPDHTYYYRGPFSRPFVIVGINNNYVLNSKLWVAVDPQSNDFRSLIDRVSLQGSGSTAQPWGFTILDHSGSAVGVWYSAIRAAAIEVNANGQIVKLAPLSSVTIGNQER